MPVVIKHVNTGTYLRVVNTTRGKKRSLVSDLTSATVWEIAGHAKNALLVATMPGEGIPRFDAYAIIPVQLAVVGPPVPYVVQTKHGCRKVVEVPS